MPAVGMTDALSISRDSSRTEPDRGRLARIMECLDSMKEKMRARMPAVQATAVS